MDKFVRLEAEKNSMESLVKKMLIALTLLLAGLLCLLP
jgi:hypothetical protein